MDLGGESWQACGRAGVSAGGCLFMGGSVRGLKLIQSGLVEEVGAGVGKAHPQGLGRAAGLSRSCALNVWTCSVGHLHMFPGPDLQSLSLLHDCGSVSACAHGCQCRDLC